MNYPLKNTTDKQFQFASQNNLENVFEELFKSEFSGCLQVVCNVTYWIYLDQGQLIYATNSLAPFERLERHLRRLSNSNQNLTNEIIKQGRSKFGAELERSTHIPADYQSINWLLDQKYLTKEEAITLQRRINREVFESLLLDSKKKSIKLFSEPIKIPIIYKFDLTIFVEECKCRLIKWKAFLPEINSSYQRPYLVTQSSNSLIGLNYEQNQTICKLLIGLNFRQIAAIIDRDELIVVKILYPSLINNLVVLRNPKAPFDLLPNINQNLNDFLLKKADCSQFKQNQTKIKANSLNTLALINQKWKIAYVDNQLVFQNQIQSWLEHQMISAILVDEPLKAFAKLIDL